MFYREKFYSLINWKNRPNLSTPLGAKNLNKMDKAIGELDERVVEISIEAEKNRLNVQNLGLEVESISKDIEEVRESTQYIDSSKIVTNKSGAPVYIDDASNMNIEDITFYGESKQNGTPTPTSPQPIESNVVNMVDVLGKNLLKFSQGSTTNNGITFTVNADKSVTVNGTATADAVLLLTTSTRGDIDLKRLTGKNIILSGCPKGGSSSSYRFQFWSDSKMAVDTGNGATLDLSTVPDTWNFAISIIGGTTVNNLTFKPMIRLASITDATYEPYQSQAVNLSAPIELNGFGGVRDTDKLKKFGVAVFDGSEAWYKHDEQYPHLFKTSITPYANGNATVLCSHFPYDSGDLLGGNDGCRFRLASSADVFYVSSSKHTDVSAFKSWLASNPVTLVYELAEAEETALPQADIDAINNLHTYKPNTVVMNDADAEMDVEYVADAKTYIDKKFEALASAIVNQ